MPDLILPNADADLIAALHERARSLGISMEEVLRRAVQRGLREDAGAATPDRAGNPYAGLDFKQMLMAMPDVGRDEDFRMPRSATRFAGL